MSREDRPIEPVYDENVRGSLSDLKQEISSLLGVLTNSVWKENEEHVIVSTTHVQRSTTTTRTNTPQPPEAPGLSFTVPTFDQHHHRQISPKRVSSRYQASNSNSSSSPTPQQSQASPTSHHRSNLFSNDIVRQGEDVVGSAFQKLTLIKEQYHAAREEIIRTTATPQTCRSLQASDAGSGDDQNVQLVLSQSRQSSVRRVLRRDSSCQSSLSVGVGVGVQCDENIVPATTTGTVTDENIVPTTTTGTETETDEIKPLKKEVKEPQPTPAAAPPQPVHQNLTSGPTCPEPCAPLPNLRSSSSAQRRNVNSNSSGRSSPAPSSAPIRKELCDRHGGGGGGGDGDDDRNRSRENNIIHTTGFNSPDPEPHITPPEPTILRSKPSHNRAALRDEAHIPADERNLALEPRKTPPPSLGTHSHPPSLQNSDGNIASRRSELGEPKKESATRITRNTNRPNIEGGKQESQYSTPSRSNNIDEFGNEAEKTVPQSRVPQRTSRADNPSPPPQAPLETKLVTRHPREPGKQSVGEQELLLLSGPGRRSTSNSGGGQATAADTRRRRNSLRSNSERDGPSKKSNHSVTATDNSSSVDPSQVESNRTSSRKRFESELRSRRASITTQLTVDTSKQPQRKKSTRNSDLREAARRASNINQAIESRRNTLRAKKESASSKSPNNQSHKRNGSNPPSGGNESARRRSSITSISPSRDRTTTTTASIHHRTGSNPPSVDRSGRERRHSVSSISPLRDRTASSVEKDIQRHRLAADRRASSVDQKKKQLNTSLNERSHTISSHTDPHMQERTSLSIQRDIERRRSTGHQKETGPFRSDSIRGSGERPDRFKNYKEISIPITVDGAEKRRPSSSRRTSSATQQDRDRYLRSNTSDGTHHRTSPRKSTARAATADFVAFGGSSVGTSPSKSQTASQHYDTSGYSNAYEKRKSHQLQQEQNRSRNRSHSQPVSDAGDNEAGPGDCPYSRSRTLLLRHLNDSAARFQHMLNRRDSGRIVTLDEYRALAPLDLNTFREWQNATQDILACMLEEVSVGRWKHKPWNFHTFMKNVRRRLQVIKRATDMNENLSSHFRTATGRKYYL
eukprot:TRINITY_DN10200_c3_g1_i1.p1 TRINITY_DN10200_c3_g1~~TRINITY_DN10200_c3_g1_i1.p1  ORF type:complete len:1084 (+),score=202.19 TRINITY_DN10200_c3_g1_i1:45-3296(+)